MKHSIQMIFSVLCLMLCLASCSYYEAPGDFSGGMDGVFGADGGGSGNADSIRYEAGVLTAAEWNDLEHWDFWCNLIDTKDSLSYDSLLTYWGYQTSGRVGLQLTASGNALVDAEVALKHQDALIWQTKTDNQGRAELWIDLYGGNSGISVADCQLYVNDVLVDVALNANTLNVVDCPVEWTASDKVDLLFMVDATGSMGDEMDFLKEDLMDVLDQVKSQRSDKEFRTASLFYRDEGDDYVVKHSDFTKNHEETINYIKKQRAQGGGDYPEAVHTAMENLVQLPWAASAHARIAFLFLDAPAHYSQEVLESLHASVRSCAKQGIKLIPVAASGVDKSTEFMLRYFAMCTCGTYVFLTDDSGVGNAHLKPSVGEYQIQSLNSLLKNLILEYTE